MCIGGPYMMGLIKAAPERVAAAIVFQTIGLDNDRQLFYDMFDGWANELKSSRPEVSEDAWVSFRNTMYGGDFLFNADRNFVRHCQTPMVVLMGNDAHHPAAKQIIERVLAEHTPD